MAAYFLDTSALVKRYVAEAGSAWVIGLSDPLSSNTFWISDVSRVEVLAAIYQRVRIGTLTLAAAQKAELEFRHDLSNHFQIVALAPAVLDRAMTLVARHTLRAYDAVQLASALQVQDQRLALALPVATFLCSDLELNRVATLEGYSVDDPNLHP
jgi:uncharacterized protein